jgi:cytochrome c551/c552
MVALRSSLIALLVTLGACDVGMVPAGGGGGGGTPDGGSATGGLTASLMAAQTASFGNVITPLVSTGQRCISCHSVTMPNFGSYDALAAKYKTPPGNASLLVTKGNHEGFTNFFNATEQAQITNWINTGAAN